MSQITEHPTAGTATTQQQGYRTATAVAQYITGITPVFPAQITVQCMAFTPVEPSLDLHFFQSIQDVHAFGLFFGLVVEEKPRPDGRPYVEASGEVDGVPVRAWTLLPAASDAVVTA